MKPIITSLLDTDFYKFTMLGFIWSRSEYADLSVKFALKNRSHLKYPLAELADHSELTRQINHLCELKFEKSEVDYIVSELDKYNPSYSLEGFSQFLYTLKMPKIFVYKAGGGYSITAEGPWAETTLCETFVLSIVTQLVGESLAEGRGLSPGAVFSKGCQNILNKIDLLKQYKNLKLVEFGTRRRYSKELQEFIVWCLKRYMPEQLIGTSNVLLAKNLGLSPKGTMAHELMMAKAAISGNFVREPQMDLFDQWCATYTSLDIALNDTFGSEVFFKDFGSERARLWSGYRPDSGDPITEGERIIKFLEKWWVNPASKTIFFADGMDPEKMIRCHEHFHGRVKDVYGPGTNFTNDVGLPTLSLVMKLVEAGGRKTVKLSNNLAKATGEPEDIERMKKLFGYDSDFYEECRY